jgi:uncharacterized protein (DUF1330 family)
MKYYFVAQIKVHDEEEYEKYLDKCDDVFSKFKGEYLAVDRSPVLLEGNWDYTKSVLIKFNSKKEFEQWYYSDDYQKIMKYRLRASMCDTILIKGVN